MILTLRLKNLLLRTDGEAGWLDELFASKPEYVLAFLDLVNTRQWIRDIANNPKALAAISASPVAMAAISVERAAIMTIIAVPEFLALVAASEVAMSAVAASEVGRAALWENAQAWERVSASEMAMGKYAAGAAGLDPTLYADMSTVAASSTAMQAVAASGTACAAVNDVIQAYRSALVAALSDTARFTKTTKTIGDGTGTWDDGVGTATIYIPTACMDDGDTNYSVRSLLSGNTELVFIAKHSGTIGVTSGVGLRGVRVVGSGSTKGSVTFDVYTVK